MIRLPLSLLLPLLLALLSPTVIHAQEPDSTGDDDGSSQRVEESDDAFRRRMELEDARRQDPTYTDPVDSYKKDLEKIDKLPDESRDNIRDQLIDVIMDNGEWEPSDALEEYPYEPTEAAEADPDLMKQEQEAWEEQVEKYHEREANAFGTHRGPVPGPGNPNGQEGGQQGAESGEGQGEGEQGDGQGGGGDGDGSGGSGSGGTYQPYESNGDGSDDGVSTDGVSESALDFLRGQQGGQPSAAGSGQQAEAQQAAAQQAAAQQAAAQQAAAQQAAAQQAAAQQAAAQQAAAQQAAAQQAAAQQAAAQQAAAQQEAAQQEAAQQQAQMEQSQQNPDQAEQQPEAEQSQESSENIDLETRGIIAIKDLDKLEGAAVVIEPEEEEEDP